MTTTVSITRGARLPDELRVARCLRAPELGPRILFFSGGTALRKVSRALKRYTHNSIHLITPFDSGGSSALLRQTWGMLSIGDLRNRLMALADETERGNPAIYQLFNHRLPRDAEPTALRERIAAMVSGDDPLVRAVPKPLRRLIRTALRRFWLALPQEFDLRGASIGNVVLTGEFLENDRDVDSVLFLFSRLARVRGVVRPVADADLHLAADLADGTRVIGQHRLTGKEVPPITSPIADLRLAAGLDDPTSAQVAAQPFVLELIASADLICFPMGSFYTSVVAALLPTGLGRAIRAARCPKVYLPNTARDPEQLDMSLDESVGRLLDVLTRDAGADTPVADLLNLVLVDRDPAHYALGWDPDRVRARGVEVVELDLVGERKAPALAAERLVPILLSLC